MSRKSVFSAAIPLSFASAMLASCAPVEPGGEFISEAPAARVVGEAQSCISVSQLRSTSVYDDRTIDFRVGGKRYRNTLPRRCPNLGFEQSISYDVRGGNLCRPEIIYVLETFGGDLRRGVGCQLGEFVPIELVKDN